MQSNSKKNKLILGITTLLISLIIINLVGNAWFFRLDLTAEKRFSLTKTTKTALKNLTDDIYITVYLDGDEIPTGFKRLRKAIYEMIREYEIYANTEIIFSFETPARDAKQETKEKVYKELIAQGLKYYTVFENLPDGTRKQVVLFPSAKISYGNKSVAVNFLKSSPGADADQNLNFSIENIEYELTAAIQKLQTTEKPKIAFIRGHAELHEYYLESAKRLLEEQFEVFRGTIEGKTGVLNQFKAIIISKPLKPFSEADKYVIDQYIMQGGNVLWLIDGANTDMDSLQHAPFTVSMPLDLNLSDQLFKYGVRINSNLLQHAQCAQIGLNTSQDQFGKPEIAFFPWYYYPLLFSNNNHPVNRYIETIKSNFVSNIDTVGNNAKIQKTILLATLNNTRIASVPEKISFDLIDMKTTADVFNKPAQPVAVLLEGEFESVFKNRARYLPGVDMMAHLDKSLPTKQIVVADGDLIKNEVLASGKPLPMAFDPISGVEFKGNSEFLLNAINYLTDNSGLMALKSRQLKLRLLEKEHLYEYRNQWQWFNTGIPLVIVLLASLLYVFYRKKKYTNF
ncbi:MAG TPA: gliding motility-associated ABC transporter substrate-binding protein GldG [Bacteroidales bacterium]|nr:gliding motility-associated ABC transporter substrate-binding protein GldG [Bacteroidales bacterium]